MRKNIFNSPSWLKRLGFAHKQKGKQSNYAREIGITKNRG